MGGQLPAERVLTWESDHSTRGCGRKAARQVTLPAGRGRWRAGRTASTEGMLETSQLRARAQCCLTSGFF